MGSRPAWAALALCVAGASCDIPTDSPLIDQRWVIPLEAMSLDQEDLLPTGVTIAGNVYDVEVSPVTASESLGNLCVPCNALNGFTVPTPPYQGSFASSSSLPTDAAEVEVASGSVDITITNGLSFDPLAGGGTLTITAADAGSGVALGTLVLDGATDELLPASVTMWTLPLGAGTVTGGIETTVAIDHVGGVTTTIDVTEVVAVDVVTSSLLVSSATVVVDGLVVGMGPEPTNVDDIDEGAIERIQSGTVVLDVLNPFGISFDGTISVGPVVKPVSIAATATSTVEISYTTVEFQSFLGVPGVSIEGSGTVAGGPIVMTTAADFSVDATIDVTIRVGG